MTHSTHVSNQRTALSTSQIADRIHGLTGHRPSRSALWRWLLSGRLQGIRIGRRLYSTEEQIRVMLAADDLQNPPNTEARAVAAASRLKALRDGCDQRGEVA